MLSVALFWFYISKDKNVSISCPSNQIGVITEIMYYYLDQLQFNCLLLIHYSKHYRQVFNLLLLEEGVGAVWMVQLVSTYMVSKRQVY